MSALVQEAPLAERDRGMDLRAYRDAIGKDFEQPEQFRYEVTHDIIRQFAYQIPDYNALYLDREYARTTRWDGVIGPPGFLCCFGYGYDSFLRSRKNLIIRDSKGRPLDNIDNAGDDWEYFLPARPGDTITTYLKLIEVSARGGARIGEFAMTRAERRYVNQNHDLVARVIGSNFHFNADVVASLGGMGKVYPPMPPGQLTRNIAGDPELPGMNPTPARERRKQRYFEDVKEGEEIPDFVIGPITTNSMGRFNAACLGRGAADIVGARQGGAIPDAFSPGPMRQQWFGSMLTRWAGPNAFITRMTNRNCEFVFVGFKLIFKGRVTRKHIDGNRLLVDLETSAESELGFIVNKGTAQIEMPGRGDRF